MIKTFWISVLLIVTAVPGWAAFTFEDNPQVTIFLNPGDTAELQSATFAVGDVIGTYGAPVPVPIPEGKLGPGALGLSRITTEESYTINAAIATQDPNGNPVFTGTISGTFTIPGSTKNVQQTKYIQVCWVVVGDTGKCLPDPVVLEVE